MRVHRQAQATTALVVLAVLLGSLWAGVLGASGPGTPVDQLTASRSLLGLEAAVLPERVPALYPSAERPEPGGRLLPLLLGLLAASSPSPTACSPGGAGPARPRPGRWSSRLPEGLAPHPASSRPDPCPAPPRTGVG